MKTIDRKKVAGACALTVAVIMTALAVSGCNTVKGVGRDIEAAGDRTQKAINNE